MISTRHYPALLLNADMRPTKMVPLEVWTYERAVHAVVAGRVSVVAEYDRTIRSQKLRMRLPSVIALREWRPRHRTPPFTRIGCYLRDGFACQYCGRTFPTDELTFDHVLPRSRGGGTSWRNVVGACASCNLEKRDRTPAEAGMTLLRDPWIPTIEQLNQCALKHGHVKTVHAESWTDFIYPRGAPAGLRVLQPAEVSDDRAFPEGMTSEDYWQVPLEEG